MSNNRNIVLLAFGAFGLYLLQKSKAGNALTIASTSISKFTRTGWNFSFILDFLVYNNSDQNLTINGIGGNLMLNGNLISPIQSSQFITIRKFQKTAVPVSVNFSIGGALRSIADVVNYISTGKPLVFDFQGVIRTFLLSFPVSEKITITNPLKSVS